MTDTKYTSNDLLFKKSRKRDYSMKGELECAVGFDEFYRIMIDSYNVCADTELLDRERLELLYAKYCSAFECNKGHFGERLIIKDSGGHKVLNPAVVFDNLIPRTKVVTNVDYYVNRCYKNAGDMVRRRQSLTTASSFVERYGEDEGMRRYGEFRINRKNAYLEKGEDYMRECVKRMRRNSKSCPEYYAGRINPETGAEYTECEIKEAIHEYQTKVGNVSAKKIRERNEMTHDVSCRQVGYWMRKGYSYDESVERVKRIHATNTVDVYVKKYGYEMGVSEWEKRKSKWSARMRELKSQSGNVGNSYSKAACKLFDRVIDVLRVEGIVFNSVYYRDKEFSKWDTEMGRVYFYDFVINDIRLCVEYNGIMFHPKAGDYNWTCLFSGKGYDEVMEYDMRKQDYIRSLGYELIVVWEDDIFEKSVERIVNACKGLLFNEKDNME